MSARKKQNQTLLDKVNDIILKQNDGSTSEDDNSDENSVPKIVDFNEYVLPDKKTSDFRKRNVKLLSDQSSKYKGKITSRKDLENDDISESDEDKVSEMSAEEFKHHVEAELSKKVTKQERNPNEWEISGDEANFQEQSDSDSSGKENISNRRKHDDTSNSDEEDQNDDEEGDDSSINENDSNTEVMSSILPKPTRITDIQKGSSVQHQLQLWEKLLEFRIHSQKILNKANQLPSPQNFSKMVSESSELSNASKETSKNLEHLLTTMLDLQSTLTKQFPDFKNSVQSPMKRPTQSLERITDEPAAKRLGVSITNNFESFRTIRNSTLLKWDDRTNLLKPGWASRKKSQNEEFNIIQKIDNILMNQKTLIKKSQTVKKTSLEGDNIEGTIDGNIFDDTDFYHQQLREFIESKASSSTDSTNLASQYVELQKLRQKMKKKVDTRASKGRKLRYVVHKKLINFMAPNDFSDWTDESKTKLYKSLFMT